MSWDWWGAARSRPGAQPETPGSGRRKRADGALSNTLAIQHPDSMTKTHAEIHSAVTAAEACLDAFMAAFNARDLTAWEATFNFPSVRLASGTLTIIQRGDHKPALFDSGALRDWDHSAWERRRVVHAGPDKVHFDTRFSRYRADGSIIGGFDSFYVVTCENGHWGVKARSSFAP